MSVIVKRTAERVVRGVAPGFDLPSWRKVLRRESSRWEDARRRAAGGPKVLIATSVGAHTPSTTMESLLAVALTLRGADVALLLCDEALPACSRAVFSAIADPGEFAEHGPQPMLCWDCFPLGARIYADLDLPVYRYSEFITPADRRAAHEAAGAALPALVGDRRGNVAVGEHALAGTLRFFGRGVLDGEALGDPVLRRYFQAALLTVWAMRRLMERFPCEVTCLNHGIYVPQGLIGEVARERTVRVVNWHLAYRKQRFIFSHHDTYHQTLLTEPVASWENLPWSASMERALLAYLRSRWQGTRDWITFHARPLLDAGAIARALQLDFTIPTAGLLTNVMWDAQLHYRGNAFASMRDWIIETVRYFAARPDAQLVIRVHPAEVGSPIPSRQLVVDELRAAFPTLPPNVRVVPPDSPISTYAVLRQCNAALIYGTKTGVELASMGIPVIVAGEAWVRNKGITLDASNPAEYRALLDRLPLPGMDAAAITRARRYAYHFFFRRMIPIRSIEPGRKPQSFRLRVDRLDDLRPGRDPGLDVVCEGILRGTPFVYPAEQYADGVAV